MKFVKALAIVASLFVAGTAFACPQHCLCDNKGKVIRNYNYLTYKTDNYINNKSNSASKATANSKSNSSSNSSATGGNATVSGVSGGSVKNSGNSTNTNTNTVAGGTASATIATGAVQTSQGQQQQQQQSVDNSGNTAGNSNVSINQEYKAARIPVATAYAAALTSGMDTCLGSMSGGAQTGILGLSVGGTKKDNNCVLIKQVALLHAMGLDEAACFRARAGKEGKAIDDAMKLANVDCKSLTAPAPTDVVTHEELKDHEDRILKHVVTK